jgi:outer membrane protein TolC
MRTFARVTVLSILLVAGAARAQTAAPPGAMPPPVPGPGAASPMKVTWREALTRALAQNPSAIVAAQEIERASGLVRQARAGWLPTLSANGSYLRLDAVRTSGGVVTVPLNGWNGSLTATLPLVAPLAWVADAHARDNREVAQVSAGDVQRQLATAVGRAYLTVLLQHKQVAVVARARETSAAHYDYAHTREKLGLGSGVDDARAEQELRTNEALLKSAETALVRAQSALAVLLSAEDLVDVEDDVTLAAAPNADAALADARAHRADVQVLAARQTAASHLRRDEWAYYAPSLLAQAQAFRETATVVAPASGWTAQLVLSIPLFEGGFRYGVRKERQAGLMEAQAQLDGLLRQVSVEVRTAFAVVRNADEGLGSAHAAAVAAATAAKLADKSYRAGASTNIEVIDAERQARDADSQVALAEDAARQARLDLLLATGAFP